MNSPLPPLRQRLVEKFNTSRDFIISAALHMVLLSVFGGTVLYQVTAEPEDFVGERLVADRIAVPEREPTRMPVPEEVTFDPNQSPNPLTPPPVNPVITTRTDDPLKFPIFQKVPVPSDPHLSKKPTSVVEPDLAPGRMPAGVAAQIHDYRKEWVVRDGSGTREPEYQFTAYVGRYAGGDWDSTVRVVQDKIVTGSLPNLLYLMSEWSKNKIKTNSQNVEAIRLDDWDRMATTKPPFIFMTGSRDFKLSEKEVANLRKYVSMGGCIWGDSSLPGLRSRFDIAFRREMKRVIPDVDKDFEPLPASHPIFTQAYFSKVKALPPGLNFYREPVMALKLYGEIAILYTANDYGDMWQTGLNRQGEVDLRRDKNGHYVAVNPTIYQNRDIYLRNLTPESLEASFQFGTNVVIHLLTRWEKVRTSPTL